MNMVTPLVQISSLKKSYGSKLVLDDVNLGVAKGETVCLVGSSGTGKTTLLRTLNLLEEPQEGTISIGSATYSADSRGRTQRNQVAALRQKSGMIFQQFNLWPHKTVIQNITEGPRVVLGLGADEATETALELLRRVRMEPWAKAYPEQLSGGQQQRVAIARSLAMDPLVLLCDEPTSALDPELVGEVQDVLRGLAADGLTMIAVTHDFHFAEEVADRIIFMDRGRIVEDGPPSVILNTPREPRTQEFLARVRR